MRPNERDPKQVRPIKMTRHYTAYAEGSVLVEFGNTKVLCNATVEENVPRWLLHIFTFFSVCECS